MSERDPHAGTKVDLIGDPTPLARAFFASLRRLPLSTWVAVARLTWRSKEEPFNESAEYRLARRRLRHVMDGMPWMVGWVKRQVGDTVDVASAFLPGVASKPLTRVALIAAFALIARPYLSETDFTRLYEPFAGLIPPDELLHGS
jgi:hypothetical protein